MDRARLDAALQIHRALLEKWRQAMDLVGPGPVDGHFEDARGAVEALEVAGAWADLGSGAGFPGIALAAAHPEAQVQLVESRLKRATFLKKVVREAGLDNATVVHGRTEDLPPGQLDGIISRAYKPPRKVMADAARLLRPGGRVALLLGSQADVLAPVGFVEHSRHRYPVGAGQRLRIVFTKEPS
jgi:16S rRNA (guanine527-N7)-methyltransferase